jgi:hypothetical protein
VLFVVGGEGCYWRQALLVEEKMKREQSSSLNNGVEQLQFLGNVFFEDRETFKVRKHWFTMLKLR